MFNRDHLTARRLMMGFTQADLADAVGKPQKSISCYETGRYNPDLDTLARMCKVLKTEPNKVLKGWDE